MAKSKIDKLFDAVYAAEFDLRFVVVNRQVARPSDYSAAYEAECRQKAADARTALETALKAAAWIEGHTHCKCADLGMTHENPYV